MRRCTVCSHPQRKEIDAAIPLQPHRRIAARFGLKDNAVLRHKANHLEPRLARAARLVELNAQKLVADLHENHEVAVEQRDEAIAAKDRSAAASFMREVRTGAELLGKIVGAPWAMDEPGAMNDNRVQVMLSGMSSDDLASFIAALTPRKKLTDGEVVDDDGSSSPAPPT